MKPDQELRRIQESRQMLGSEVVLTLVGPNSVDLLTVIADLWTEIQVFEATFSRFQPDSELTQVNQRAGTCTSVSQEFVALASSAKQWSVVTGGLYNPFVLPALQTAGYQGSWPNVEKFDPATNYSGRQISGATDLQIEENSVQLPANSALDFGGIGKGYLLDQLGKNLPSEVTGHWFSLGGDILCGGYDDQSEPWRIGIQKADGSDTVGFVSNSDGQPMAIATSGITKRRGTNWHHIIDPRTALPADTDLLTATITASSATEADVYAKCLVILGSTGAKEFIKAHKISTAVLQYTDQAGAIQIYKTGEVS